MKKILLYFCIFPLLVLNACDKEGLGDNYNFDNKVPPYVAFSSLDAVAVKEGTSVAIPFLVRTAIQEDLTITLSISGDFSREQTVILPRGTTSVSASVAIPTGVIKSPATSATATVAITKAITKNGAVFSLGRLNNPDTQKKVLNITLP